MRAGTITLHSGVSFVLHTLHWQNVGAFTLHNGNGHRHLPNLACRREWWQPAVVSSQHSPHPPCRCPPRSPPSSPYHNLENPMVSPWLPASGVYMMIICVAIESFTDSEERSHDGMLPPWGPHGSAKALWGSRKGPWSPNDLWECQPCLALAPTWYLKQEASLLPTRVTHIATDLSGVAPSPLRATTWIGQLPR